MLNKAVMSAKSDYIIFIDGDCIPDDRFVEAHLEAREKGFALSGRRVYLSDKISKNLRQKVSKKAISKRIFCICYYRAKLVTVKKCFMQEYPFC